MKVEDLLTSERSRGGFSKEEREAMWKGIQLSVAPVSASAATSETKSPAKNDPGDAPSAAAPATAASAMKIGALLSAVALGGALGAAAHATLASPAVVYVDRVITAPAPSAPAPAAVPVAVAPPVAAPAASPSAAAPAMSPVTPRAVVSAVPAPPSPKDPAPKDPGLARERTLLDMARTALTRGDNGSALSALDTHAHDFPSSQLGEEREVLAVQALAAGNRLPEAQKRAAAFRARYPKSPLLPIVNEAAATP